MVILNFINRFKSNLKLFYAIFISSSKFLSPPPRCDVLIYDKCGSEGLMPYLKKYRTEILAVRGEQINLYCMLRASLTTDFWIGRILKAYTDEYIKCVTPNLCITFIDNNPAFYSISNRLVMLLDSSPIVLTYNHISLQSSLKMNFIKFLELIP